MRRWLAAALLALGAVWLVWYVSTHADEFAVVRRITWTSMLLLVAASFVYLATQAKIMQLVVRPYGPHLGNGEALDLISATLLANYVYPFTGIGLRAVYLKRVRGLGYDAFAIGTTGMLVIEVLVYACGGLLGMWLMVRDGGMLDPLLTLVFAAGALCFAAPVPAVKPARKILACPASAPMGRFDVIA